MINLRAKICNIFVISKKNEEKQLNKKIHPFYISHTKYTILDFDNASKVRTDNEICDYITSTYGLREVSDILLYSRDRQRDILRLAKEYGASIRQLSRLTGISVGIIRNV